MYKIITCNTTVQYNLGGPSILHGIYNLLWQTYGDDFEMVNLQVGVMPEQADKDMPFKTLTVKPFRAKEFFKVLFGGKNQGDARGMALSDAAKLIREADLVIDLNGICFCDRLSTFSCPAPMLPLYALMYSPFVSIAKKYHVRCVKNTASYGPAVTNYTRGMARFVKRYLFDCMVAREKKSRQVMCDLGVGDKVLLAPDIANLMESPKGKTLSHSTVGISTSHQIIRQWHSKEDYVQCMANLCYHIIQTYGVDVLLIPNECDPNNIYNDIDAAEDILELLHQMGGDAEILDAQHMCSTNIKNQIASCDVVVASRYHSCVAALSSGIPLMVIGWHYKYEELLEWYGQEQWILSEEDCDTEKLVKMFDELWRQRDMVKAKIQERIPVVCQAVLETGRKMLNAEKKQ